MVVFKCMKLKLLEARVSCGLSSFESPATDYVESKLSIDELVIDSPSSTFLARAEGNSLTGSGIFDGDILIVSRHVKPKNGDVIVCNLNGLLTAKVLDIQRKCLISTDDITSPYFLTEGDVFTVEGVIQTSLRLHSTPPNLV